MVTSGTIDLSTNCWVLKSLEKQHAVKASQQPVTDTRGPSGWPGEPTLPWSPTTLCSEVQRVCGLPLRLWSPSRPVSGAEGTSVEFRSNWCSEGAQAGWQRSIFFGMRKMIANWRHQRTERTFCTASTFLQKFSGSLWESGCDLGVKLTQLHSSHNEKSCLQ